MQVQDYLVKDFSKGTITRVEKESIPRGASSGSLNWISLGDRIELRRGQAVMGNAISGLGKITGMIVTERFDKTQVALRSRARKIESYNSVTETWDESGPTNILPIVADGEDVAFSSYHSIAGAMVHASSPNSSAYKILIANPTDALDQGISDHRGKIRIKNGRTFLWDRKDTNGGSDKTGLYGSWIDKDELSDFTEVVAESLGTGDATTVTFTGTLTMQKTNKNFTATVATDVLASTAHGFSNGDPLKFTSTTTLPGGLVAGRVYYVVNKNTDDYQVSETRSGTVLDITSTGTGTHTATKGVTRSVMYVRVTDTKEQFQDDRNGNLIGNKGGTGTINYATGAYSVTFATAPAAAQGITATYYWEDATDEGVWDFTKSSPRDAGEGFVLRQDDGGAELQNIATFANAEYCLHNSKTWALTISADDSTANQEIYRDRVGIPYWRAMVETGEGIYYLDDTDAVNPFVRLLTYGYGNQIVRPKSISDKIDLSAYEFDFCEMYEWGLYIIVCGRTKDSTINNRMFFYHKLWQSWDITDYRGTILQEYVGGLIAGDSGSSNVFYLFDGFADENSIIPNYWNSGKTNLDIEGVKRCKRMVVRGMLSIDQIIQVRIALDGGEFIDVEKIYGNGSYVDFSQQVVIGSKMNGSQTIGGEGGIDASPFAYEFKINTDKFEDITVQFEALEVGFASVSEFCLKDIRYKGRKLPIQYRTVAG